MLYYPDNESKMSYILNIDQQSGFQSKPTCFAHGAGNLALVLERPHVSGSKM